MAELTTPAGKPVEVARADINADFDRAMSGDVVPDEVAPPKRQAPTAQPDDAPKPKRGRPPKAEKARTTDKAAAVVTKDDYTEDAQNLVGAVWTVAASIPVTQPYALVVHTNADALSGALAEGAKHNATIRAFVSSGQSSWMLGLASVGLSMGMQAFAIAKDPQLREKAAAKTRADLMDALVAKGIQVPEAADVTAGA